MAMAAMNMVSTGGSSGVSFHLIRCPQGVASVICKKTPIFGSRRSKLDRLTVRKYPNGVEYWAWTVNVQIVEFPSQSIS